MFAVVHPVGSVPMMRVLLLAGTTEATALAGELVERGHEVVSSFAGVTTNVADRPGEVRSGGFGGVEGLRSYLSDARIEVLVDATHPFAAVMPHHAAAAAAAAGLPHVRLLRPGWEQGSANRWVRVGSMAEAATTLAELAPRCAFLAVGRQQVAAFQGLTMRLVVRSIEPVEADLADAVFVRQRGPFTLEGELALMLDNGVEVMVTKDAGGTATQAKLIAARELGITVVMVERPAQPDGVTVLGTVAEATAFVGQMAGRPTTAGTTSAESREPA